MSLVMHMMGVNARLSGWRQFDVSGRAPNYRATKNTDKLAAQIVAQITHQEVVELLVREWTAFPADLRLQIATLCNARRDQPASGNQANFIKKLDERLGGKLLRTADADVTHRDRRWISGEMVFTDRRVDPAVAGAQQAALHQRVSGRKKKKKRK